jgi:hypothetical protein
MATAPVMPSVPLPGTPTPPPVGVGPGPNAGNGANPFLSPVAPPTEGGAPRSFLPPPPTPPPGLGRTLPPIPTIPPQKMTSSAPPISLGTTVPPVAGVPPVGSATLMTEITLRTIQRRGKNIAYGVGAAVALIIGIKVISASSSASTQEATGIRVASKQAGIKLLVDGKLVGPLPQEVKGMSPGEHAIVFDAGERYAQQRRTVDLIPGEMKDLEPVTLKVTKGSAIFDVKTPGAQLALVSSDERRELTDYSHAIDVDNTKNWTLEATKRGYKTVALPVTFDERAEKTFTVQLNESGGVDVLALPSAAVTITEEPTAVASLAPEKATKAKKKRAEGGGGARYVQPAASPMAMGGGPAVGSGGTCSLNINTIPSSRVTLDGRNLGTTPRLGVMVASGQHNIVFTTENARKATVATCRAGETKTVAIRMPD